jgi:LTXXQ motif family protein
MSKVGAYVTAAALAAACLAPRPTAALGLQLGPLHLSLPFFAHSVRPPHHHRIDFRSAGRESAGRADNTGAVRREQTADAVLLYPNAALPVLFDEVFFPARASSWPFGYAAIFRTAFAKPPANGEAQACRQPQSTDALMARIRAETSPDAKQQPLLEKLGRALGAASAYLIKMCSEQIPQKPVARLQLMQSQIEMLTMALDVVRGPLQQYQQSLTAAQRSRFAATEAAASGGCEAAPAATDGSIRQISRIVQAGEVQRTALANLHKAFDSVASDLQTHCPKPLPPTPLLRLEATEARLDAAWRAALAMHAAIGQFEATLSTEQRGRLEAVDVTAMR